MDEEFMNECVDMNIKLKKNDDGQKYKLSGWVDVAAQLKMKLHMQTKMILYRHVNEAMNSEKIEARVEISKTLRP